MKYIRWWLSVLNPFGVLAFGGLAVALGWSGRRWWGVLFALVFIFVLAPAVGHLQNRLLVQIDRMSHKGRS